MGIAIDFLIKHVRPVDDGVDLVCGAETRAGLRHLGLTTAEIDTVFAQWTAVAALTPTPANQAAFEEAAWAVSRARWDELKLTKASTVVFLNAPLLKELSYRAEQHAGDRRYDFEPAEHVPLAVTLHRHSGRTDVVRGAPGFEIGIDHDGLCDHFERLLG